MLRAKELLRERAAEKAREKEAKAKAKEEKAKSKAAGKGSSKAKEQHAAKRRLGDLLQPGQPPSKKAKGGADDAEEDQDAEAEVEEAPSDVDVDIADTSKAKKCQELLGGASLQATDPAGCLADPLEIERKRVEAAIRLLRDGNTIPFIARYRKERTAGLKEEQLRTIERGLQRLQRLEERRLAIALALTKRGALQAADEAANELRRALLEASNLGDLEDIYAPYKAKKQTRAQAARGKGLTPLADLIMKLGGLPAPGKQQQHQQQKNGDPSDPSTAAMRFLAASNSATSEAALAGARDIVAERLARSTTCKTLARTQLEKEAGMPIRKKEGADPEEQFKTYWNFETTFQQMKPHQFLAIQRGEAKGALKVSFNLPDEVCKLCCEQLKLNLSQGRAASTGNASSWDQELSKAVEDGFKRLLRPSLEREWRRRLKQAAEEEAFKVFRQNLSSKLMTPPLRLHPDVSGQEIKPLAVLGIDPAFRTGCKLALISCTGNLLSTGVIWPPFGKPAAATTEEASGKELLRMLEVARAASSSNDGRSDSGSTTTNSSDGRLVIALGGATASRETEAWLRDLLRSSPELTRQIVYSIVDEAGASVYSASPLALSEMPDQDVTIRGAVSIARRLLDPMAELVKVDPQSLGVGLYQHDVDQKKLAKELEGVVSDCVSAVGVDVNTASPSLLKHIAGLSQTLSQSLVEARAQRGSFPNREALRSVKGLGPKIWEQCAGFLRVYGGSEPLDATSIHPESYSIARRWLQLQQRGDAAGPAPLEMLATEWGVGNETLADIKAALEGNDDAVDPRKTQEPLRLKRVLTESEVADVKRRRFENGDKDDEAMDAQEMGLTIDQIMPGMKLNGVVRNVVPYGAFVDVGLGHDGLMHSSKFPAEFRGKGGGAGRTLQVNDRLEVWVESATKQPTTDEKGGGRWKEKWKLALSGTPMAPAPQPPAAPAAESWWKSGSSTTTSTAPSSESAAPITAPNASGGKNLPLNKSASAADSQWRTSSWSDRASSWTAWTSNNKENNASNGWSGSSWGRR